MNELLLLASALAGIAVALACVGAVMLARAPAPVTAADLLVAGTGRSRRGIDLVGRIERSGLGRQIAADLRGAGMRQTAGSFLTLSAVVLALGLLVLPGTFGEIGVVLAAAAALTPYVVVRRRAGQHAREFRSQLPALLDLLASALRAGQSEVQAFELAGAEMRGAAGEEFRRMHQALALGATVEAVSQDLIERLPDPDLELAVDAIQLSHRVGGNLAQMLADIATTIRARTRLQGEINALTAQGRASVWLVTALAPIGLLAISLLNASWAQILFQTAPGRLVIGLAAVLELVGFVTASRAAKVDV